ncbi:hypothetical protein BvCmsOUNP031_01954 [Escherichia coli]|nr:hypothetical protein BvCmsOUNP031_01954 [Escherichia coli]
MTTAPDTAPWPPDYPDRDSDRDATSHPRDENPASQSPPDDKHPGTACNSPSPRDQSAFRSDVARSGIYGEPPDRPATTANHSVPAADGRLHSARADHRDGCGPAPPPRPVFVPAASLPVPSGNTPPEYRRYSRREDTFPPPAFSPRSRTTPLAHIAGRAPESLIQSLSWIYCESLLMERKPPKLPTLLRNLQPLRHLLHLSFVISDVGWSYSSATAGP